MSRTKNSDLARGFMLSKNMRWEVYDMVGKSDEWHFLATLAINLSTSSSTSIQCFIDDLCCYQNRAASAFQLSKTGLNLTQSISLIHQLSVANTLGEGVIWQHHSQRAYWTDIQNKMLYSWQFGATSVQHFPCPERLGCFGLTQEQDWLICAFESGFAFFHPKSGQIEWIAKIESNSPHTRLNDGRVDRQGRFWAGTMMQDEGLDESKTKAALYRLEHEKSITKVLDQIKVSNGLCWSPKGDIMYFADSPTQKIFQAKADPITGKIGPLTDFSRTQNQAFPDGSCVDSEGCIWNAEWGGRTVKRYSPEGNILSVLDIPCEQPTCVAFGGPNLQHLIVTSARQSLSSAQIYNEPSNGDVFVFKTPYTGLQESICTITRKN